ncbi:hypothetical protein FRC07_004806 [Ceratobasidium sp. 392]|nr:hypothetical protein FRC07_004806 [Ceratobasidium sp. 392]
MPSTNQGIASVNKAPVPPFQSELPPLNPPAPQSDDKLTIRYEENSAIHNRATVFNSFQVRLSDARERPTLLRQQIVEKMGVFPPISRLAYAIVPSPRPIRQSFDTEEQILRAVDEAASANARKKSIEKVLEVTNVEPVEKATGAVSNPAQAGRSKNKKAATALVELTQEEKLVKQIRSLHRCEICPIGVCFVDPATGKHVECSHQMITLWAKRIVKSPSRVNLDRPPNHHWFDVGKVGVLPGRIRGTQKAALAKSEKQDVKLERPTTRSMANVEHIVIEDSDSDSEHSDDSEDDFDMKEDPDFIPELRAKSESTVLPEPWDLLRPQTETLLCSLHCLYPDLNLPSYAHRFRSVDLGYVHLIAERSPEWISQHVSLPYESARIVLAAAWMNNHKL